MLDRVSDPQLSPDGRTVAFAVRETDFENNKGVGSIWTVPFAGGDPRRLTPEGTSANSGRWAPDGRHLYYLSAQSGSMQLWRIAASGGKAEQISDYPLDIGSYKLAPDGARVAMSFEVFADCDTLACTRQRLDGKEAGKASGVLFDRLFVRHWDTWKDGRLNQLFVAAPGENGRLQGEPQRVSGGLAGDVPSRPFGDAGDYTFAPDGASIVFAARESKAGEPWSTDFDLYRVALDRVDEVENLTVDNEAWDTAPVFSPDGGTLYYLAMARPGFEADRLRVMARDLDSGQVRAIAPDWDRSPGGLSVSADGGTLYATADALGEHPLFAIEARSGKVRRLTEVGYVGGYDVGARGIVIARDTLTEPADLFTLSARGGKPGRLTRFNAERLQEVAFGDYEQFEFAGWNGETVRAYIVKPWNYTPGQRYPVAFLIHGGPQGSFGDHFHHRWNPQTYAGSGYAAVMVDFHGSTGYGQAFTDSISGDWGGKPLEDLRRGWAAALAKYDFLDADRACALGASYGGYMVNWIAGHWQEPWKCLVNHDGVFDNRMMYYATEELWFPEWEHGGPYFQVPENYEKHNPVNHVGGWRVPMLVVQGELDYRIPVTQSLATFTALQRQGIPSRLLYFPDENHWVLKPHNSVLWHRTVNEWLDRWTGAGSGH
ncbi:MAG TPA: S9 family peptidase [Xanthomonadaceae bacterium]|nr:S9 family peptidase [Xanthomonadaceae bacterium]